MKWSERNILGLQECSQWLTYNSGSLLYLNGVCFSTTDSTSLNMAAGCWTERSRVLRADESVLDHRCHSSARAPDLAGKEHIYVEHTVQIQAQIPFYLIIPYIPLSQKAPIQSLKVKVLNCGQPLRADSRAIIDEWVASSSFFINTDSANGPNLWHYHTIFTMAASSWHIVVTHKSMCLCNWAKILPRQFPCLPSVGNSSHNRSCCHADSLLIQSGQDSFQSSNISFCGQHFRKEIQKYS